MLTISPKRSLALLFLVALLSKAAVAAPPGPLKLPNFDALAAKAVESVNVTLDSALLSAAAGALDPDNPEDAAAREVVAGLKGIYVRSYTFESDFAYSVEDVEAVRKQLSPPTWQQIVSVRKIKGTKGRENVDIYVCVDQTRANGLAIIATEPKQFTIVNIVGSIDLQKLRKLQGKFGIPQLPQAETKPSAEKKLEADEKK
jgi:hypothetical protein